MKIRRRGQDAQRCRHREARDVGTARELGRGRRRATHHGAPPYAHRRPRRAGQGVLEQCAAPANEPRNAPITLPTTGTGTPIAAPTIPPTSAPHADRREPPYVRAKRNPSHHSMISPRKARPRATPMVATPTERKSVSQP